jgi:hypothetical protein
MHLGNPRHCAADQARHSVTKVGDKIAQSECHANICPPTNHLAVSEVLAPRSTRAMDSWGQRATALQQEVRMLCPKFIIRPSRSTKLLVQSLSEYQPLWLERIRQYTETPPPSAALHEPQASTDARRHNVYSARGRYVVGSPPRCMHMIFCHAPCLLFVCPGCTRRLQRSLGGNCQQCLYATSRSQRSHPHSTKVSCYSVSC